MEITTINGVRGFIDENGVAQLNAEDIAIGWGFTQEKSGKKYVRWETVNGYLADFGFSQLVGKDDYLPENMAYRLGFKASNEAAQVFQAKLADEILPAIRKHGGYLTPAKIDEVLSDPDTVIKLAMGLKEERKKRQDAEKEIEAAKPKVIFADSVSTSNTDILVGELAKLIKQNGVSIGQNRLFNRMRNDGYLIRRKGMDYNMPTQRAMELGLFRIKETTVVHSDGHTTINKTPKITGKGQLYFVNKYKGEI